MFQPSAIQKAGKYKATITDEYGDFGKIVKEFSVYNNNRLSKIEVVNQPTKKTYEYGDDFDPSGMTVRVTYADGVTEIIEDIAVN